MLSLTSQSELHLSHFKPRKSHQIWLTRNTAPSWSIVVLSSCGPEEIHSHKNNLAEYLEGVNRERVFNCDELCNIYRQILKVILFALNKSSLWLPGKLKYLFKVNWFYVLLLAYCKKMWSLLARSILNQFILGERWEFMLLNNCFIIHNWSWLSRFILFV